jgi:hypothetical protein
MAGIPVEDKYLLYFPNGKDPVFLDSDLQKLARLDAHIKSVYRFKSETEANFGRNRCLYKSKVYFVSEELENSREHFLRVADLAAILKSLQENDGKLTPGYTIQTEILSRKVEEFAINPSNGVIFTLTNSGNIEILRSNMSRQLDPENSYGAEFYSSIGLHSDQLVVAGCCPASQSYILFGLTPRLELKFAQRHSMTRGRFCRTNIQVFLLQLSGSLDEGEQTTASCYIA